VTVMVLAGSTVGAQLTHAQTCQELWVEQNAYYNAYGYCFTTVRETSYFDTAGCSEEFKDRVRAKFPSHIRERVKLLEKKENDKQCSKDTTQGPRLAEATCNQLWVERNAYYKAFGYCFRGSRAISYFGDEECVKGAGEDTIAARFPAAVRARIENIIRLE